MVALLVFWGPRYLAGLAAGILLLELVSPVSLGAALAISVGDLLECTAGCFLLRRWLGGRDPLGSAVDLTKLIVGGAILIPAISALGGAAGLVAFQGVPRAAFGSVAWTWYTANLSGFLVGASLLFSFHSPRPFGETLRRWHEVVLLVAAAILLNFLVFGGLLPASLGYSLTYLPFLVLASAALRLDQRATTAVTALTMLLAVSWTLRGSGPFVAGSREVTYGLLNLYLALMTGITLVLAVFQKVRIEKDEALRASEARFRSYFELGLVGVAITSPDGRCLEANEALCEMLGYSREEMIGKSSADIAPPEDREADARWLRSIVDGEFDQDRIFRRYIRRDGGTIHVEVAVRALRDSRGRFTGILAVVNDVTVRLRAETALRTAKEQAEAASRAKSEFLANMSHEIRTPLNAVIGFASLAMQEPVDPKVREYLEGVEASGQHLLSVISDILDFSKIEAGRIEPR